MSVRHKKSHNFFIKHKSIVYFSFTFIYRMNYVIEYVKSKYKHIFKKKSASLDLTYDRLSVVRTYHIVIQFVKSN